MRRRSVLEEKMGKGLNQHGTPVPVVDCQAASSVEAHIPWERICVFRELIDQRLVHCRKSQDAIGLRDPIARMCAEPTRICKFDRIGHRSVRGRLFVSLDRSKGCTNRFYHAWHIPFRHACSSFFVDGENHMPAPRAQIMRPENVRLSGGSDDSATERHSPPEEPLRKTLRDCQVRPV